MAINVSVRFGKKEFLNYIKTLSLFDLNAMYDRLIEEHSDAMWLFEKIEEQEDNLLRQEKREKKLAERV